MVDRSWTIGLADQAMSVKISGASIAGMVCGIVRILLWALPIVALVLGIVGVAMSSKGMKEADAGVSGSITCFAQTTMFIAIDASP